MLEPKLEDYPFDPNADVTALRGLEKLRAFEDPKQRLAIFNTYMAIDRNRRHRRWIAFRARVSEPDGKTLAAGG